MRDFRGVSDKAFDGRGNYSLGLREHTIFPELNLDKVEKVKGLTISINTTARSDFEGYTCCARSGCRFAARRASADGRGGAARRREHRIRDGEDVPAGQGAAQAQVQGAPVQPLSAMRPRARVLSAFQDVPAVPAQDTRSTAQLPGVVKASW